MYTHLNVFMQWINRLPRYNRSLVFASDLLPGTT